MNIIFKMLKYLKKHYSILITSAIIIVLAIMLIVQSVILSDCKSSYQEEVKLGSAMKTELDSIKKQNEVLNTQIADQEKLILESNTRIQEFEAGIKELEEQVLNQANTITEKDATITKLTNEISALKKQVSQKSTSTSSSKTNSSGTSTTTSSSTSNSTNTNSTTTTGTYSQATQVWNGLKAQGFNDYVCAGIMGNIMAEVGGQTLDISRWPQYSQGTYYGICQWAGGRKQRLLNNFGTTLEDQIRFLSVELLEVIPKGNSFYNMQDEKQAALYFAQYYERCGSGSYSVRQSNATKALNYFVG